MISLAIVCVVKNEADNIAEWIAFHFGIGAQTILVYDNESVDATRDIVLKFTPKHDVRLIKWNLTSTNYQRSAFINAASRLKNDFEWVAFIDADEFIMSENPLSTLSFLRGQPNDVSQVCLNWAVFGSSGHVSKPNGLVIENFNYRSGTSEGINRHVKSIARPGTIISAINPHVFKVNGRTVDVNGNDIEWSNADGIGLISKEPIYTGAWINHYSTKSQEQWLKKLSRGYHDISIDRRGLEDLIRFDQNCTIKDTRAQAMVSIVNELMGIKMKNDRHNQLFRKIWRNVEPYDAVSVDDYVVDLQGWGSKHEYLTDSIEIYSPKIVIEIGVWKGGSTVAMAKRAVDLNLDCSIISVDTWLGAWDHWMSDDLFPELGYGVGSKSLYDKFLSNVKKLELNNTVIPLPLDSTNACFFLRSMGVVADIIHIDAGHDYAAVLNDLNAWWEVLRPGGLLIGDDYDPNGGWPDVKRAFDDFIKMKPVNNFEFAGNKCRFSKPV